MNTVKTENVTKKIRNNLIINRANFKLERGKIYGLVGANGSGKSTLLKILLGLTEFKGKVFINGYNIKQKYKETRSVISGIVDYVCFYDYLTAEENLRYFALCFNVPLERVNVVLKIVSLDEKQKPVKYFSLGMKQRLGIAISLLKDPEILILDEPINGLDPKGIKELRELLCSLKDKTIIISSHIIPEIEKVSDEILFIHNNVIEQRKIEKKNTDNDLENLLIGMMEEANA